MGQQVRKKGGGGFVDRGDPAGVDYDQTTLTIDSAWHDLNLSAIVPAGAKAITMNIQAQDGSVGHSFRLRKNGNVNARAMGEIRTQVANVGFYGDVVVACDADRIVEYYITTGMDACYLVVKGWWL